MAEDELAARRAARKPQRDAEKLERDIRKIAQYIADNLTEEEAQRLREAPRE